MPAFPLTPRERLRICTTQLSLDEFSFDVVLANELFNRLAKHFRHRHRFDKIDACYGEGLSFRGIGGDRRNCVGPGSL